MFEGRKQKQRKLHPLLDKRSKTIHSCLMNFVGGNACPSKKEMVSSYISQLLRTSCLIAPVPRPTFPGNNLSLFYKSKAIEACAI
ncbi:hypothetical protein CEXT_379871 [Caerostris extrusa]|uniref:Uncharacterized protein n=1 Tax=Caerostris extrusa TaxID=172846 RepID=A0AAV4MMJ7_CAEEX|nr:hypothetical protein CEXT_379871 [Caerostris extrusa]